MRLTTLKAARARGACNRGRSLSCDGQGPTQVIDRGKGPSHQPLDGAKQNRARRAIVVKATKSATYSEDPWQEDSVRHEVLESMEEVGP